MIRTRNSHSLLNIYGVTGFLTVLILVITALYSGPADTIPIIALMVIEITFSFDNAVINSHVLTHLSNFWRTMFLTIGVAVAVFGARLILPLVMVSVAAGQSLGAVFNMAINNPELYSKELHEAYPVIAAFGGVFLLMIALRFFGEKRSVYWLDTVEAPLGEFNQPWWVVIAGALGAVSTVYFLLSPGSESLAIAAILGAMTFITIKFISERLVRAGQEGRKEKNYILHGKAAFMQFVYLELFDASFSFDGVVAAFAITKKVLLIASGLGIGALYVRAMTVHLLRRGSLEKYRYLIHGAHYAIGTLALVLLLSIRFKIPEMVTGFLGLIFIGTAIYNSITYNRNHRLEGEA